MSLNYTQNSNNKFPNIFFKLEFYNLKLNANCPQE